MANRDSNRSSGPEMPVMPVWPRGPLRRPYAPFRNAGLVPVFVPVPCGTAGQVRGCLTICKMVHTRNVAMDRTRRNGETPNDLHRHNELRMVRTTRATIRRRKEKPDMALLTDALRRTQDRKTANRISTADLGAARTRGSEQNGPTTSNIPGMIHPERRRPTGATPNKDDRTNEVRIDYRARTWPAHRQTGKTGEAQGPEHHERTQPRRQKTQGRKHEEVTGMHLGHRYRPQQQEGEGRGQEHPNGQQAMSGLRRDNRRLSREIVIVITGSRTCSHGRFLAVSAVLGAACTGRGGFLPAPCPGCRWPCPLFRFSPVHIGSRYVFREPHIC